MCRRSTQEVEEESSVVHSTIQSGVKVVREGCCDCVSTIKAQKKPIDEFVSTGIDHSQCKLFIHC